MTHHLHTDFSDGKDSPEDMLKAALTLGWKAIGFSDHAPVEGEPWCMKSKDLDRYFDTLGNLKLAYAGRIEVQIGLEMDWSEGGGLTPDSRVDYWIGSLHFFEEQGRRYAIDGNLAMVTETLERVFDGDGRRFSERYYHSLTEMIKSVRPPILGHLDLLKKQNTVLDLFAPDAVWYQNLVAGVLDAVEQAGSIIEVNTGGMARGYTTEPYPSWAILDQVRERNLPIQLNSDSHQTDTIDFGYNLVGQELQARGFSSQRIHSGTAWIDRPW